VDSSGQILDSLMTEFVEILWEDLLGSSGMIFDTCGKPLFTPTWIVLRLYFTTYFHTHIARSEVSVRLPLFTPMLTGVRQLCFAVGASVGVKFGSHVNISDVCGG
jgi:hypothetical protein